MKAKPFNRAPRLPDRNLWIGLVIGLLSATWPRLMLILWCVGAAVYIWIKTLDRLCDFYASRQARRERIDAAEDITKTLKDPGQPWETRQDENGETVRRIILYDEQPWETLRRVNPDRDKTLGEILRGRKDKSTN